jgi:hypothetical protein
MDLWQQHRTLPDAPAMTSATDPNTEQRLELSSAALNRHFINLKVLHCSSSQKTNDSGGDGRQWQHGFHGWVTTTTSHNRRLTGTDKRVTMVSCSIKGAQHTLEHLRIDLSRRSVAPPPDETQVPGAFRQACRNFRKLVVRKLREQDRHVQIKRFIVCYHCSIEDAVDVRELLFCHHAGRCMFHCRTYILPCDVCRDGKYIYVLEDPRQDARQCCIACGHCKSALDYYRDAPNTAAIRVHTVSAIGDFDGQSVILGNCRLIQSAAATKQHADDSTQRADLIVVSLRRCVCLCGRPLVGAVVNDDGVELLFF